MKNYYDMLEVHPESSQELIEATFHSLYGHYNPDNFSSPEEKSQAQISRNQIKEAYNVLSNPKKRAKYDKYYKSKKGHVETQKIPGKILIAFFAITLIIIVAAQFIADTAFKYFTKLTHLIETTPSLKNILAFIVLGIAIHFIWKNFRKAS